LWAKDKSKETIMANPLKLLKLKPTGFQFIKQVPIQASPKKVWSSLLNADKWFRFDANPHRAPKHSFKAIAGSPWLSKSWDGNTNFRATVSYVEPGKLLRLVGQFGMTHLPVTTVVIFELQPKAGGKSTLLRLGQRSFGFIDADMKKRSSMVWKHLLPQLKELAEK
jgi:uncharacterized protein YndB with AHSA1/START domain